MAGSVMISLMTHALHYFCVQVKSQLNIFVSGEIRYINLIFN